MVVQESRLAKVGRFLYLAIMIQANELRIGNRVLANRFEDDEPWETTIEEIEVMQVTASLIPRGGTWVKYADLEPIPLTTKWLERFGFTNEWPERNIWELKSKGEEDNGFRIQGNSGTFYLTPNYEEIAIGKGFHFVHQLQNLYFALTDEELTIKETV